MVILWFVCLALAYTVSEHSIQSKAMELATAYSALKEHSKDKNLQ